VVRADAARRLDRRPELWARPPALAAEAAVSTAHELPAGAGRSSVGRRQRRLPAQSCGCRPALSPLTSPMDQGGFRARFGGGVGWYGPAIKPLPASTLLDSHDTPRARACCSAATGALPWPVLPGSLLAGCALPLIYGNRDGASARWHLNPAARGGHLAWDAFPWPPTHRLRPLAGGLECHCAVAAGLPLI